jgi:hypothetical protein
MPWKRLSWRPIVAVLIVVHGWAHAVLPLRGLFDPELLRQNLMPAILYGVAMLGFTAAGLGLLGIRFLRRSVRPLLVVASVYSLVSLLVLGQWDLWWGGMIDVVLLMCGLTSRLGRRDTRPLAVTTARPWLRDVLALLVLGYTATAVLWPVHRVWGSQPAEHRLALLGDDPGRDAAFEIQHGVTIDAAPGDVWPWILQIGQDRAGFYSYDWLERAFGVDVHNVVEIRPEWQHRQVGDLVRATQSTYLWSVFGPNLGWRVLDIADEHALVLEYWGTFALVPTELGATRFIIRTRVGDPRTPVWAAMLDMMAFQLPHFVMERRMMLRIKGLAEGARS